MTEEPEAPPLGSDLLAPDWKPPHLDIGVPTPARMYDFLLGGKDHFPVDREAAEELLRTMPLARVFARANRDFLGRAVRGVVAEGVEQFLDIGVGLPGPGGTVETALSALPGACVVGIDNDPIVLAHARALPAEARTATIVAGDLRNPAAILAHPEVRAVLDFDRPIAVLLVAILHFVTDDEDPRGIIDALMGAVAPGSCLVISHGTGDFDPEGSAASAKAYEKSSARTAGRTHKEITGFFDGLDLLDPGVVTLPRWRPDAGAPASSENVWLYGGVARKP